MATTTPNFGWAVPTSTDLVKDGAVAIETLGDSIDASLVDLKGGTTGQVLSKASNTDMDFTWVTDAAGDITGVTAGTGISGGGTSGTVTVTNSMATAITTAGDLIKGTGSGTFDRLGIGSSGQVLTVTAGAPAWATPAAGGGGKVLQVVQDTLESNYSTSSGTYNDTGLTVTITPSSATSKIMIISYARVSITSTGTKTGNYGAMRLVVGATPTVLQEQSIGMGVMASTFEPEFYIGVNFSLLHSPATTSATTYKIQAKTTNNSATGITGDSASQNSIVVMEIGA
jgi:hypothetical protein